VQNEGELIQAGPSLLGGALPRMRWHQEWENGRDLSLEVGTLITVPDLN
jgi:hypothetical protein